MFEYLERRGGMAGVLPCLSPVGIAAVDRLAYPMKNPSRMAATTIRKMHEPNQLAATFEVS
jgi:hypothetical protein